MFDSKLGLILMFDFDIGLISTNFYATGPRAVASDAPLIGLNAPLKNHCLSFNISGALLDLPLCAELKDGAPERSGCPRRKKKIAFP